MKVNEVELKPPTAILEPQALTAERAVLVGMLYSEEALLKASEILVSEDFYVSAHGDLFRAFVNLHAQGRPVDFVTIPEWFKEQGLDRNGKAVEVLAEIADQVSAPEAIEHHCRIIKKYVSHRRALSFIENARHRLVCGKKAEEVLSDLEEGLRDLKRGEEVKGSTRPKPLEVEETAVGRFLDQEPEPIQYVFDEILPAGILAGIVAGGGTGKTFFMAEAGMSAAAGEPIFHKQLRPSKPHLVLYLAAEDPEPILHSRVYHTFSRLVPQGRSELRGQILRNFHVASAVGRVGPLMQLDGGNPVKSQWWFWLYETIESMGGVDLLMLDPKSRLYGLEENSNDHNTAWVSCLEEINRYFGCTTLFSHHVSKRSGGALEQDSSRGGKALTDACRWVANLRQLDEKTASRFGVSRREFVEFDVTKNNYAPHLSARLYWKRSDHGVLVQVNLELGRLRDKARELCEVLAGMGQEGEQFTRRELREPAGKKVRDELDLTVQDMLQVVDVALEAGWMRLEPVSGFGKRKREVLVATSEAGN